MAEISNIERVRVFVAVELPGEVKAEFASLTSSIDALGVKGARTVRPNGIHITLKFLGDVNVELIPEIQSAMDDAASRAVPFDLSLGNPGSFPNPGAARVLWVGVAGDFGRLNLLQKAVERSLSDIGFKRERRRFNPHITAGRIRDSVSRADRRLVTDTLFSHEYARPSFRVESISLMRSILRPDGAIYEPTYTVGLASG